MEPTTAADKPTAAPYFPQIDALKGIAIFFVVLGHSIILYPIDLHQNSVCEFIFRWVSSVHMPLFFVVSGFCYSYRGNYRAFLGKKCRRLLLPYFAFNLLDMVPRYLFPSLVNRPRGIGESIRKMFLSGGEYWFLYTLFLIFLLYPLIDRFRRGSPYRAAAVLAAALLLHFRLPYTELFTASQVVHYLFYFTIGVTLREYCGTAVFPVKLHPAKAAALAAVLLLLWVALVGQRAVGLGITTALVGMAVCYLCTRFDALVRGFRGFGKYSLQIYLFNGYLLVISRTIIVTILGVVEPAVVVGFNLLVDLWVSYLIIKHICGRIALARFFMGM